MAHLASGIVGGIVTLLAMSPFMSDLSGSITMPASHGDRAAFADAAPVQSVNRAMKGDRLLPASSSHMVQPQRLPAERAADPQPSGPMPVGCEPAISTMSDRALARVPSRCLSSIDDGRKFAVALR
jgi:hypothetical protein